MKSYLVQLPGHIVLDPCLVVDSQGNQEVELHQAWDPRPGQSHAVGERLPLMTEYLLQPHLSL